MKGLGLRVSVEHKGFRFGVQDFSGTTVPVTGFSRKEVCSLPRRRRFRVAGLGRACRLRSLGPSF